MYTAYVTRSIIILLTGHYKNWFSGLDGSTAVRTNIYTVHKLSKLLLLLWLRKFHDNRYWEASASRQIL